MCDENSCLRIRSSSWCLFKKWMEFTRFYHSCHRNDKYNIIKSSKRWVRRESSQSISCLTTFETGLRSAKFASCTELNSSCHGTFVTYSFTSFICYYYLCNYWTGTFFREVA
uniref:Uncharacterized protein n=1 Tax=Cacopsylla melanoneura TaxID=428564 RepID=A0A8D8SFF6_9HEMI